MIFCFPFTYWPDPVLGALTTTLGAIMLMQPLEKQVPPHMQKRIEGGDVRLFSPAGIDGERLERAMQAFTAWAAMHGHKPGALKSFFQASQGAGQWLKGPPTNEIRAELRKEFQEKELSAHDDALFQAGFFLALAHRYDRQQDDLAADLGSVHSLETQFGEILGEAEDRKTALGPDLTTVSSNRGIDPGGFMTARRLEAWARVAVAAGLSAHLLVTTSRAVWEQLDDHFSEMGTVRKIALGLDPKGDAGRASLHLALADAAETMACSGDPETVSLDHLNGDSDRQDATAWLTFRVLSGVTPPAMMARLTGDAVFEGSSAETGPIKNCVVGHITLPTVQV